MRVPSTDQSQSVTLVTRALEELRMTADAFARSAFVTREQLDAWTLAPATMPRPIRLAVGLFLGAHAISDEQCTLGQLLAQRTAEEAGAEEERFVRDELRNVPRDEREACWNAHLASPLVRHPNVEPSTVADLAAKGGVTVGELLDRVTR